VTIPHLGGGVVLTIRALEVGLANATAVAADPHQGHRHEDARRAIVHLACALIASHLRNHRPDAFGLLMTWRPPHAGLRPHGWMYAPGPVALGDQLTATITPYTDRLRPGNTEHWHPLCQVISHHSGVYDLSLTRVAALLLLPPGSPLTDAATPLTLARRR
jgi:hypothetical protein